MVGGEGELKKHLFINGKQMETKEYAPLYSPYTRKKIAEVAVASREQVKQAITVADEAKSVIANMPAYQRAEILENVVNLLKEQVNQAAEMIAQEAAKPIVFAKAEVVRTIETYKFAAEEAKRIHGETIPFDAASGGGGRFGYTVRKPIGVIGAITPFNFPMNLVAHKVGPAIAAGNTIVLKPASQTPLSALFIAELFQQAGLPDGVFNVVTGAGRTVGDAIVEDDRVSMVTFTGSPSVGIGIRNKAGLKRTTLELGSNAAVIIDRGVNIDSIIERCVMGAFSNQGQVCISLQRAYVHEEVYEEFVTKFVEATKRLKLGDPLDSETDISALISPEDTDRSLSWIEEGKQKNAKVAIGGNMQGTVLEPTVMLDVAPELKVSCQEVFAPIVLVNKVASVDEAISYVNDSRYGLQAGIYTENVTHALKAAEALHVGAVMINDVPTFRVDHMPYGGVKESGTGREGIKYAVEEMTELKLIVWNQNECGS
ncbi:MULTISPECIES: aldehyde dehydrogenase family protein [Bacillus cereus group]|uniref:Aldehyde dehydrogenase n=1 Tax=Bacillus cytotoxicus (strain DSM 22905 / CIP 110041 / 391-98 / NVH 391-98) TaxID=315749 RepID=A7GLU6_BACCN|nr:MULTISPECIES: aldehyde dehydrogenase family protein [Bacillus cereus group]ABS21104.1 aldehyde dehydrogenase [Bacillus cytotoxicus NVH 391-98]AWC43833.1 aldehyde dehydrogenase [Bacillus cytotoxicus]NZD31235.1 aldehyde dehydrogenase family protein [Bacillus cytotoxicus]HDR7212427.1 aldehyde dehydrogenase family protein [Bacillus cytotoxicus]